MAFALTSPKPGVGDFASFDTTRKFPVGTKVMAWDPIYGEGTFIYLPGVASTVAGSLVTYNTNATSGAGATALTASGTAATVRGPAAVSMSANVATTTWGWYCIRGAVPVVAGTVVANALVYATATGGSTDDAVVASNKVDGALYKTADGTPAAGFAVVQLLYPSMNGNG
jgi:hypothetical protein